MSTTITPAKTFLATKAGIAIVIGTISLAIIGGTTGTYFLVKDKPVVKDVLNRIATLDKNKNSEDKKTTPIVTVSPQSTSTPTLEPEIKEYKDEKLRITFNYNRALKVKALDSKGTYYLAVTDPNNLRNKYYPYMTIQLGILPQTRPLGFDAIKGDTFSEPIQLPSGGFMVKRIYKMPSSTIYAIEYLRYLSPSECLAFYSSKDRDRYLQDQVSRGCYLPLLSTNNKLNIVLTSDSLEYDFSRFDSLVKTVATY